MSTTETDPGASSAPPRARVHLTAGDWIRGIVFLGTVVLFAAGAFLGFGLIFGLVFNEYTINPIFFFVGWFAFRHGFTEYRNRLSVRGTATAKVKSAAIGLVELSGRGSARYASEAPVTKKASLFWRLEVQQKGDKGFRWIDSTWERVTRGSSGELDTLVLEDDTGQVLLWARDAEIIPIKDVWRSNRGDVPDDVKRFVAAMGKEWPSRWSRSPIKVTEERIEQDGPLYVMGTLAERRQIPMTRSTVFTRFLDSWAPRSIDVPTGPFTSVAASFTYARKVGVRWFVNNFRPFSPDWSPPKMDPHDVLVWKGDQGRPFIISGVLEAQALSALSRRSWLYLLGGAGVMVWMLWEFLEKLTGRMHW